MSTAPPSWNITQEQAQRFVVYIQEYRRYAWEYQAPSPPRNEMIRFLQMVQGKLMSGMDQPHASCLLFLTQEERYATQRMTQELLVLHGKGPASEDRNRTIADLAKLKTSLTGYANLQGER